jgi:SAM-dependent methyltransferase
MYLIPKYATGNVLDIGAGRAKYRSFIEPRVGSYTTSDIDPSVGVHVVADAAHLSVADAAFDTVLSFELLEHVPDPNAVVSEMYRVLKKGGRAIVTVPFLIPQHADPSDYQRYTVQGLRILFEKSGFKVLECAGYGSIFAVISEGLKFIFLNPYKKSSSRITRSAVGRLCRFLSMLDRKRIAHNPDFYVNTYIVAQK